MDRRNLIALLREVVKIPGPSGFESMVGEFIVSKLRELGFSPVVDNMGNVVAEAGEGPTLVVAAHMDELGLVVTGITEEGLLTFRKLGGIDDRVLPGSQVEILTSRGVVPGVIGITPPHLQDEKDAQKVPSWRELRIDVGATSREEAEEIGIKILDPAVFSKSWIELGGGRAVAVRSLDDRAGVAILLAIAEMIAEGEIKPNWRVLLAWTVQEEVGLRGAQFIASKFKADAALIVDTMACCREEITGDVKPGGGPVLRALDNQYIAPPGLREWILNSAREAGVKITVSTAGGSTDAAALQRSGIPSVALGIPVRYAHSIVEMAFKSDIEDALKVVASALERKP
ncbi:MAG: M42 family metallopeptidase [Desulfurococcales archaeon]|nr:M42 family metallopeptidase [Desulfurococcales archaeon]